MNEQIKHLYNPLFLYIRKRISYLEDAEDLTQEVFYKLAKSDQEKIKNVKHWVYTIAKNTITDYYRKKKIYTEDITNQFVLEDDNSAMAERELSGCITHFINELPEEYRQIMRMSELENRSQKDIAEQLNMNYITVRSKIQRGRKKIKDVFTDCCTILQGGRGSIIGYQPTNRCKLDKCNTKNKVEE